MTSISNTADVSPLALVGVQTTIGHLAQVREGAIIGDDCVIGRGAYIGSGVRVGRNVKIQNYALVYAPAVVGDGAFIGPGAILTNDRFPRAVNPDGSPKSSDDWEPHGVTVLEGASIGARAVCVAPLTIGRWALVAAGAVVVGDVPNYALVVGAPARRVGWVGPAGVPLVAGNVDSRLTRPRTGAQFREVSGTALEEI